MPLAPQSPVQEKKKKKPIEQGGSAEELVGTRDNIRDSPSDGCSSHPATSTHIRHQASACCSSVSTSALNLNTRQAGPSIPRASARARARAGPATRATHMDTDTDTDMAGIVQRALPLLEKSPTRSVEKEGTRATTAETSNRSSCASTIHGA